MSEDVKVLLGICALTFAMVASVVVGVTTVNEGLRNVPARLWCGPYYDHQSTDCELYEREE